MDSTVLSLKGTIEELTIYLQLCRKLELKVSSELILSFENLTNKQNFERKFKFVFSDDNFNNPDKYETHSSKQNPNAEPIDDSHPKEGKIGNERTLLPKIKSHDDRNEQIKPKSNNGESKPETQSGDDHRVEEIIKASNTPQTQSHQSNMNHSERTNGRDSQMKTQKLNSDDESDFELTELENNAHNLKMVEKLLEESPSLDPLAGDCQKIVVKIIDRDPIKMKYILLQLNEPKLKGMIDKHRCVLAFDEKNLTEFKIKGIESNVNAFQKEFYDYISSIKVEQLDRTFTTGEFNLLLRCKILYCIMQEQGVRLISFNYNTKEIFELRKHETLGFLLGQSKDRIEFVKKRIENIYPCKITMFCLQNQPPFTGISNEALEEYLRMFYLAKISEYFRKFDQQLGIDLNLRETRGVYQYHLVSYGSKNINKEVEYAALDKSQEVFVLVFSVFPFDEEMKFDDEFWKFCNEFSQRILKMRFVLKCKLNGKNGGLIFALVGKVRQYSEKLFPRIFEKLPLFQNKKSEGRLILKSLSNTNSLNSIQPKKSVILTFNVNESCLQYNLAGDTKEMLETASIICNFYYVQLKNRTLNRESKAKEQRQDLSSKDDEVIEFDESKAVSLSSKDHSALSKRRRRHIPTDGLEKPADGLEKPAVEENPENINTESSQNLCLNTSRNESNIESQSSDQSSMLKNIKNSEVTRFREIELLEESPKKLESTGEESLAVKKLLKEKFGWESPSAIVFKFSCKTIWENYCTVRSAWLTSFGNQNGLEQLETELVAQIALYQEDLDNYCKDEIEFNQAIRLRDKISKDQITQEPLLIEGKSYNIFTIFLAFLPMFKKTNTNYLMTGSYAAYPIYFVFIPT